MIHLAVLISNCRATIATLSILTLYRLIPPQVGSGWLDVLSELLLHLSEKLKVSLGSPFIVPI